MFHNFEPRQFIIGLVVLIVSIALHEFGHAFSADRLGDATPRRDGRVTLWPDKHFEPFGFIMIVFTMLAGFGIGWGKPVMINPRNFKNPRRDDIIVTACGPLMNLLIALVFGLILRMAIAADNEALLHSLFGEFAQEFLIVNLALMFFNLIPIYPLDGSHILRGLLPTNLAVPYSRFMMQWGPIVLLLVCFSGSGILSTVVGPAVSSSVSLILGLPSGVVQ
ncbi:MAG TPA: site-2 protease family protein [Chthonomonadaceae bacterium]|nr:site-2 protease family protein [Chthonomonadaceae bacterium]